MLLEVHSDQELLAYYHQHHHISDLVVQACCIDCIFQIHGPQPLDCKNSVFLGCQATPSQWSSVIEGGGLVYPNMAKVPFTTFRNRLYSAEELYQSTDLPPLAFDPAAVGSYERSYDRQVYLHCTVVDPHTQKRKWRVRVASHDLVARNLHDTSLRQCLDAFLVDRKVVAIMGGHDVARASDSYRGVAQLAYHLTQAGYLVATGGGPGLMEAANLGAFLSCFTVEVLQRALTDLKVAPSYKDERWLEVGWRVRHSFLQLAQQKGVACGTSLGIPTWFYGHEPPNVFSSHICKLFENSLREEGLLAIATSGLIVGEGNAGTVQEIFQDACQNYYATYGFSSPSILLGKDYWSGQSAVAKSKSVWPLLQQLAKEKNFENLLLLTDDLLEAQKFIEGFQPPPLH